MLDQDISLPIRELAGEVVSVTRVRGAAHEVLDVRGSRRRIWVKRFADGRAFRQSLAAQRAWEAALGDSIPALLVVEAASRILGFEHVDAVPVDERDPAVHEAAGRWLSRAHAAAPIDDGHDMDLGEAMRCRFEAWVERALPLLAPGGERALARWSAHTESFAGERRVLAHRDFGPHNWLRRGDGRLVVVDLEHARADHWLVDRVKLVTGAWRGRADLESAFSLAHGRALLGEDAARQRLLVLLHGLAMLVWGAGHGDRGLHRAGSRVLAELGVASR